MPIVFSVSLLVCSLQVGQGVLQHKPMVSIFDNMFLLLSLRSGNVGWMYVWQAVFMSYAEGIAHFTELPGEIPNRWSK